MATDETKIALVQKDIEYIKKSQDRIESALKELGGVYATKAELKEVSDKAIALEKSSNLWKFLSPTFGAAAGSILTILISSYLHNLH